MLGRSGSTYCIGGLSTASVGASAVQWVDYWARRRERGLVILIPGKVLCCAMVPFSGVRVDGGRYGGGGAGRASDGVIGETSFGVLFLSPSPPPPCSIHSPSERWKRSDMPKQQLYINSPIIGVFVFVYQTLPFHGYMTASLPFHSRHPCITS